MESVPANRKIRPWMLVYTISIGLFGILATVFGHHKHEHHYPIAYEVGSALAVILMFAGNFLYAFAYVTPLLRKFWKFAFPLILVSFVATGVLSFFEKGDHPVELIARVLGWITMVGLFFPSFRANFLLGYGDVDRVRTVARPVAMSEEPLHNLVREMARMRRTAQISWVVVIVLLALVAFNSFFQFHIEAKDDSWVTVRRLADRAKYQEALTVARHLVEKDPDSPQTWMLMGNLQLSLGQLHQAEGSYTRAYELLPNQVTASLLNAVRARIDETDPIPTPTPSP
jgi:tetratricopeptide (TPR) repeat protein